MHYRTTIGLMLAGLLMLPGLAQAQSVGSCEPAIAEANLDINNVRARILNNGGLFWRGDPYVYEVPIGGGENSVFASGIWLGGFINGQLRMAATTYGPWEFWAGPLDPAGNPPADCGVFDRVYKVSKEDVQDYENTGVAAPDLEAWPTGLGAPTLDAEGNTIELDLPSLSIAERAGRTIDLAAGERPAILGDQMVWWVMNDRGNTHEDSEAPPLGVEVHGTAFGFNVAGPIGNTTFYKYRIISRNNQPITDTYMGIFVDPDLGNFDDDYIGSDTTLGLGFVYNADNDDEGHYGTPPPALGYDFFQGPLVNTDGEDNDLDGEVDEEDERLKMTSFTYYNNGGGDQGDPNTGTEFYNYMRGRWRNGQSFTIGGDGFGGDVPVSFAYPGDPVNREFWSEINSDGAGTPIAPADRRFVMATGPFTIQPGDEQEIVFGVIWSRGNDFLDSVAQLRLDDELAQAAYDVNFELPDPPAAPRVEVNELANRVVLEWGYNPTDNNYLARYTEFDPLAPEEDNDYVFEGYKVFQYTDPNDQTGRLIGIYDKANGITRVVDSPGPGEPGFVALDARDTGLQNYHIVDGLTNYRTYYFGVQAFAYNELSSPKIYEGPIRRVEAVPSPTDAILSDQAIEAAFFENTEADFVADNTGNIGQGVVRANVVNPAAITGDTYVVRFYTIDLDVDGEAAAVVALEPEEERQAADRPLTTAEASKSEGQVVMVTVYDIVNETTGEVVFDGAAAARATGEPPPLAEDVVVADGLSFTVLGPSPGFNNFIAVANAAGPIDPPDYAAYAFNSSGFPHGTLDTDRPTRGVQQANSQAVWGFHAGGAGIDYGPASDGSTFLGRATRGGGNFDVIGAADYEMRFTYEEGSLSFRGFEDGAIVEVPFELWNVGVGTPDDPSDDFRLVPIICEELCGAGTEAGVYDIGGDHAISGADNDPMTDWIYWYEPGDTSPGEGGYEAYFAGEGDLGDEILARTVLVQWNGGEAPPYTADLPEPGTVFRIVTDKPNQPDDAFTINTTGYGAEDLDLAGQEAALEDIGIVPNPYKGSSEYETSQLTDQVRFTGLPDEATIRVFTLSGTLIKTLNKNSPGVNYLTWDLVTDQNLPIASGMYLVHVEVPGVGEHVVKFGVVKKRTQLNTF